MGRSSSRSQRPQLSGRFQGEAAGQERSALWRVFAGAVARAFLRE